MVDTDSALVQRGDNDYELQAGASCWITAGGRSVYITVAGGEVNCRIFPLNDEMADPLAECSAEDGSEHCPACGKAGGPLEIPASPNAGECCGCCGRSWTE